MTFVNAGLDGVSSVAVNMGVSRRQGANDPLEFENDDVSCSPVKYSKLFARAYGARIKYT